MNNSIIRLSWLIITTVSFVLWGLLAAIICIGWIAQALFIELGDTVIEQLSGDAEIRTTP